MAEKYQFIDINASGEGIVAAAFDNQVAYCTASGADRTARICAALRDLIERGEGGAVLDRVRAWEGAPLADALPLRVAGGLHSLHLKGTQPALAAIYTGQRGVDDAAIVAEALHRHEAELLPWLDGPPQTNEAGRSANFIAAMLWLADKGLPPRFECLEIGSSAGINLMLDRYHYDLGGVQVGPEPGAIRFAPEWQGDAPPAREIEIVSTKGCDVAPVDLADPEKALRLKAYIWPEHTVRFERIEAAIAEATKQPPDLAHMNAADFVDAEMAKPQAEGTTRVLMHSIVWQYVPADQQARVIAAMEAAGAHATPERPLAWIALEANRVLHVHEMVVRYWPGGDAGEIVTRAHPHGAWIAWGGSERTV
ncbi:MULTISPECIES: DUF2332 domain-containing protein [unclassified Novosphingobium]|uniref:DUF2332 domain-containing protein n=1 Tax=unclassified Novosphingobium TaxID=2644732 RepID=UPI000EC1E792|nr:MULTISPECIES: DUF2332 domain-containing protein [unclassified Novosphingobium]HCF24116.1 DUF2332 domain-containing protein [Novosphingobium sp.]HQV04102.1 DUF2332 domain-containing protein [Novosphingobium sp.]